MAGPVAAAAAAAAAATRPASGSGGKIRQHEQSLCPSPAMLLRTACARGLRAPAGPRTRARSSAAPAAAPAAAEGWEQARPFQEMPGPEPVPLIGNFWRFLPGIGEFGRGGFIQGQARLRSKFGDLVRVSPFLSGRDGVFVFDPSLAQTVFRQEGRWPIRLSLDSMLYYRSALRAERYQGCMGIAITQGKEWADFRSKVNQPMMQPASAARYLPAMNEVADEFVDRMRTLRDEKSELPANFINELYKWSLESIATVALDTRLGCLAPGLAPDSEAQRMIDAVQVGIDAFFDLDVMPSPWRYISTPKWRRFVKAMDYFNEVADKYVAQSAAAGTRPGREPSILQRLQAEDPRVGAVMAADMLFAGVDTTSHAFGFLLYLLAKHPQQQRRLREELARELPSGPRPALTEDALPRLPYLRACLRESLRLFPIAPVNVRTTGHDMVVGDYRIPEGTDVLFCHAPMSRDPAHFPDPERFEPRRWVRGDELAHSASPFVSLPFGFGPRMCVGRRFAELEVYTLLAKTVRSFRVEYRHGELQSEVKTIQAITSPLRFRLTEL